MLVIALNGDKNVGKSQSLRWACELLLHANFTIESESYRDLENGDFRVILNGCDKKVGILTQGDYENTLNLLKKLEEDGCEICLCACTNSTEGLKEEIEKSYHPKFIHKGKAEFGSQLIENFYCAVRLIVLLEEFFNNSNNQDNDN